MQPTYHIHKNKSSILGKWGDKEYVQNKGTKWNPTVKNNELSNLLNKEFKVIILNMLEELKRKIGWIEWEVKSL